MDKRQRRRDHVHRLFECKLQILSAWFKIQLDDSYVQSRAGLDHPQGPEALHDVSIHIDEPVTLKRILSTAGLNGTVETISDELLDVDSMDWIGEDELLNVRQCDYAQSQWIDTHFPSSCILWRFRTIKRLQPIGVRVN